MIDDICGAQRPGFEGRPHIGSNSIPCVLPPHSVGVHRNGLGQAWEVIPPVTDTHAARAAQEAVSSHEEYPVHHLRRAPWTTPDGKPAFISSEPDGIMTCMADAVEANHLNDARVVKDHARASLADEMTAGELRWLTARLVESLTAAVEVAVLRGERLGDVEAALSAAEAIGASSPATPPGTRSGPRSGSRGAREQQC